MNRMLWVLCCVAALLFLSPVVVGQEEDVFGEAPQPAPQAEPAPVVEKSVLSAPVPASAEATPDFCQCAGETNSPTVAKIEAALVNPLRSQGLDFSDTPLEAVAHQLQDEYGFPVQLDKQALEEIGISTDEPVNIHLNGVSLRSGLRHMLKELQLTYLVSNEVLLITTPEAAESQLVVCVYDVGDLVGPAKDESVDQLTNAIVSCVCTETWALNGGGEAEIQWLKPGFLVVSQTQAVHEEVRSLLATIRDVRQRPAKKASSESRTGMMSPSGRGGYGGGGSEGGYGGGRGGYQGFYGERGSYGGRSGYGEEGAVQPTPTPVREE